MIGHRLHGDFAFNELERASEILNMQRCFFLVLVRSLASLVACLMVVALKTFALRVFHHGVLWLGLTD